MRDLWSSQATSLQVRLARFPFVLLRVSICRTCGVKESHLNVFRALRVLTSWCSKLPERIGGSEFSPIKKRQRHQNNRLSIVAFPAKRWGTRQTFHSDESLTLSWFASFKSCLGSCWCRNMILTDGPWGAGRGFMLNYPPLSWWIVHLHNLSSAKPCSQLWFFLALILPHQGNCGADG